MKKPSKKANTITVNEFKSWMAGVEDMQESGWVPNKIQWDRIKSKISLLSDDIIERVDRVDASVDTYSNNQTVQHPIEQPQWNTGVQGNMMPPATYFQPQQQFVEQLAPQDNLFTYSSGDKIDFL